MDESTPQPPATPSAPGTPGAPDAPASSHTVVAAERPADETIKETLESIVIAFILAFVFRAYVVEAFVIPTGSMAPTLLGAHVAVTCDQCGYPFDVDPPDTTVAGAFTSRPLEMVCPMCRYVNTLPQGHRVGSGDRILVHKYIYSFSEPRRWDVVVFKAPHQPETNFIKRLVGLENEALHLYEGNVYVRPLAAAAPGEPPAPAEDSAWRIARKSDRPAVQRAVWQPIYHSNYLPLDGGGRSYPRPDWAVPWVPVDEENADAWRIDGRRSYVYSGQGDGQIRFAFERNPSPRQLLYPYNQAKGDQPLEPLEDIRLAATVRPDRLNVGVALSTTARLDDPASNYGVERLQASLAPDGTLSLEAINPATGASRTLGRNTEIGPLEPDDHTRIELWYVDQEASVWVDGERVLQWRYDLDLESVLLARPKPDAFPDIRIAVSGGGATLFDVQVDRDLYYSTYPHDGNRRGALERRGDWEPLILGDGDYFCVGDNGPRSYDGRYWSEVNPWVEARMLDDRVQAGLDAGGIVPRDLMMGRAFFVYFPAPYTLGIVPLPNFGDMRFIH